MPSMLVVEGPERELLASRQRWPRSSSPTAGGALMRWRKLVFGVGLPRSGTTSVRVAMEQLGYYAITDPHADELVDDLLNGNVDVLCDRIARAATRWRVENHAGIYVGEPVYAADPAKLVAHFPDAGWLYINRERTDWMRSLQEFTAKRPGRRDQLARVDLQAPIAVSILAALARSDFALPAVTELRLIHRSHKVDWVRAWSQSDAVGRWGEVMTRWSPDGLVPLNDRSNWQQLIEAAVEFGPFPWLNRGRP